MSHHGIPLNPDATDSLGRQRRWARCQVCGGWLLRVSILRHITATAKRRTEWHHRSRRLGALLMTEPLTPEAERFLHDSDALDVERLAEALRTVCASLTNDWVEVADHARAIAREYAALQEGWEKS